MLNGKSLLITGGTGSFGKAFVKEVLARYPDIGRLAIYSRDELKQFEMGQIYSQSQHPALRYFLGDVRDKDRLRRALEGIDIVVHAAALKQVPAAEYNPFEFINTNVLGAQNLIEACLDTKVSRLVALSTDKAAAPINLYGATKLCSDKLFVAANSIKGARDLSFSVVRYGNVMGSRGSVIPFFLNKREEGVLPVTDPAMTRFSISLTKGVEIVLWAIENALGGEVIVPKIPSYNIQDVARAIAPNARVEVVGIRPGEKLHEEMITESDGRNTFDIGPYYVILPGSDPSVAKRYVAQGAKPVPEGFHYDSFSNPDYLTAEDLRVLIRDHVEGATFEGA